jgi:acetolactate synthase-1/2/3 large subunit
MIGYNHNDFARNAYKISVDIDPKELMKPTVRIDMPVNADVLDVLRKLNAVTYEPQTEHEKWRVWCRERIERYPAVLPSYHGEGLINPYVFIDKLFEKLDENDRVITGNGAACVITFQTAKIKKGQRMFTNSGCEAMGYGFPAAIGAAVSDNSRRTICIDGDGSFMMNLQELATVAYNKLDLKLIILNNNGYLSIRQTQRNLFKPPFIGIDNESGICFPDFGKLSEAFGIPYYRLDSEMEAGEVLDKALTSQGPCVIEAVVDPSQNFEPKSSSKMLPDGKMVSTSLDDMAPFLSEEEMKENRYE